MRTETFRTHLHKLQQESAMSRKRLRSETRRLKEEADAIPKLVSFKKADVPLYLHQSEFYLSLAEEDEQEILVPRECFKADDTVSCAEDLRSLLLTLRFWVAKEIGDSVLEFVLNHPFESYGEVFAEFYEDMPDILQLEDIVKSEEPFQTAIHSGILRFVQYMHMTGRYAWPDSVCEYQAVKGDVAMLKYAIESGCTLRKSAMVVAALKNHVACLQLLHEHNCPWDESTTDEAAHYNSLECLQYAHENGCPWKDAAFRDDELDEDYWNNICSRAAARGNFECLKYAFENGVPLQLYIVADAVACKKRTALQCVKFLHSQGQPLTDSFLCEVAVCRDDLAMLKYLHENGSPWTAQCFILAVINHNIEIVQYLHTKGCVWDVSVCERAVSAEDAEIVKYLIRNGCPLSDNIWTFKGDLFLDIFEAFQGAGLTWEATPGAMTYVVWHGDVSLIQLMRDAGFPWADDACAQAAKIGALERLKYIHTDGGDHLEMVCDALVNHWESNKMYSVEQIECFKYAHQRSQCKLYKNYTFIAARDGQLELLMYLHEQGCKWDAKAAVAAAKNGHAECLEYLLCQGGPHSKDICIVATKRRQEKCLDVAKKFGCV